jgi:MoxR-like ATPase
MKTSLGYPSATDELRILDDQREEHPLARLQPVIGVAEVIELQHAVAEVYIDGLIQEWIIDLVRATRELDVIAIGSSVRGSLALERAARAWALLSGRDFVVPSDVDRLFIPVLGHRITFSPSFLAQARRTGWAAAMADFERACLERAPRPELVHDDVETTAAA